MKSFLFVLVSFLLHFPPFLFLDVRQDAGAVFGLCLRDSDKHNVQRRRFDRTLVIEGGDWIEEERSGSGGSGGSGWWCGLFGGFLFLLSAVLRQQTSVFEQQLKRPHRHFFAAV